MNVDTRSISKALTDAGINRSGLAIGALQTGEGASLLNWSGFPLKIFGLDPAQNAAAQAVLDANPIDLEIVKAQAIARMDAKRAELLNTPITFTYDSTLRTLTTDERQIAKLISDVATSALDTTIVFPTVVGPLSIPTATALTIATAIKAAIKTVEDAHWTKVCTIRNASTVEAVNAVTWL